MAKYSSKNKINKHFLPLVFFVIIVFMLICIAFESTKYPKSISSEHQTETTAEESFQSLIQEKTNKCMEDNPTATEDYCTDLAHHDIALKNEDMTLCEKIMDEKLKNHCFRSLG